MSDLLKWLSTNTITSGVIGSLIAAAVVGLLVWTRDRWVPRIIRPALRKTHAYPSDQSTTGAAYPLKYYLEVINDSKKCVAVRVAEYIPNTVSLQKFVPDTLQVMLAGNWLPTQHSVESVALLPHQRCRAWVGADPSRFSKADLEKLEGKIGKLILTANGKRIPFNL